MLSPIGIPAGRERQPASAPLGQDCWGKPAGGHPRFPASPAASICPAFVHSAERWEDGSLPCFQRAVCLPTKGSGMALSSWSLARQPWEKQVLFHGKVLRGEIAAQPGQPHSSPGPSCSGVSPVLRSQAGGRGVAWGLRSACCLLPGSSRLPSPLLRMPSEQRESLPQRPPMGSSTARGCERGSPRAGAALATCLGLISYYAFLQSPPNELSWGSPKPCRQSWDEDFAAWGPQASVGGDAGPPHAGFSSLSSQQGACHSATRQRAGKTW